MIIKAIYLVPMRKENEKHQDQVFHFFINNL